MCWSTTANPALTNEHTTEGNGIGTYSSAITGLTPNTQYHVRAYATNSAGTAYGNDVIFTSGSVTAPSVLTMPEATATTTQIKLHSGGEVTASGGAVVTERGICWDIAPNPTILNNKVSLGAGPGAFETTVTNLKPATYYYIRAYAINAVGTSYGEETVLLTKPLMIIGSGVTDRCGNVYTTVILADREWMAQNLRATCYQNNEPIQAVTNQATWNTYTSVGTGVYLNYENNVNDNYGKLYSWYAITDSRKISPQGWSIPSEAEFQALRDYLGGWQVAGGPLKATESGYWTGNIGATNTSGFSALPAGSFDRYQLFENLNLRASFWSSKDVNTLSGQIFELRNIYIQFNNYVKDKSRFAASVRCIKNL